MSEVPELFDEEAGSQDDAGSRLPAPLSPDDASKHSHEERKSRRPLPSLFWPLVLIGAGVILLLSNLGYLPYQSWNVLWRLWPLLLVALGIDLVIGRRSVVGAVVSAVLILLLIGAAVVIVMFAQNIPALSEVTKSAEWRTEHVEYPLASVETASVSIDYTALPGYLSAAQDSPNLIEADVTYRGDLVFDADVRRDQADVKLESYFVNWGFGYYLVDHDGGRWDVRLSPKAALDLSLDTGSGRYDFDLSGLQISDLFIDVGSGSVDLTLPSEGRLEARIDGGSGGLDITLPETVGMRVELDSGSGAFRPDERFRLVAGERDDDGVWETENLPSAEHTIVLEIDQGSGSISVR
jgi:hypothetical protein